MSRLRKNKRPSPLVWAEVDLGRVRRNLRSIRRWIGNEGTEALCIVKADAYGHGMAAVARALEAEGVSFFGVANIEEALELRRQCPSARILVLGSFDPAQASFYVSARVRPTLSSVEDVHQLEKALPRGARFPVHAKIDTGMGRLGVWFEHAEELFDALTRSKKILIEGVYTHFASADEPSGRSTREQIDRFKSIQRRLLDSGVRPKYWHAANSLGLMRFQEAHLNLVRPGILLYGLNPWGGRELPLPLESALSWKTKISFLKHVPSGRTLSYGATYKTSAETWIGTLPVGYSHGYRVAYSNKASVLIGGRRCPVVGRVTMDQTLVDLGSAGAKRWQEVVLIGHQGKYAITSEEMASLIDTIPYEVVCSIHSRIPRIYKGLKK
jgi:alanine racemase